MSEKVNFEKRSKTRSAFGEAVAKMRRLKKGSNEKREQKREVKSPPSLRPRLTKFCGRG